MKQAASSWIRVLLAAVPAIVLALQMFGLEVEPGTVEKIVTVIGSILAGAGGIFLTARAEPMGKKKEIESA